MTNSELYQILLLERLQIYRKILRLLENEGGPFPAFIRITIEEEYNYLDEQKKANRNDRRRLLSIGE